MDKKGKVIGTKGKIVKSIIAAIILIAITTTILVINGVTLSVKQQEKIEKERTEAINELAVDLKKVIDEIVVDYKDEYYFEDGMLIDFTDLEDYEIEEQIDDLYKVIEDGFVEIDEGKLFKDIDGNITILSNVSIGGRYCIYEDEQFICNDKYKKDSNITKKDEDKVYAVGDVVTLSDGTTWRVIRDSSKYSEYVTLLSDNILYNASNASYLWNFSPSADESYNKDEERSIAYYLDSKYNRLFNYEGLYDSRLLSYQEYDYLEYDYDWLDNSELGNWMLYDYAEEDAYYVKAYSYGYYTSYYTYSMYSYDLSEVEYSLRPVITIRKDKIDTSNINIPIVEENVAV